MSISAIQNVSFKGTNNQSDVFKGWQDHREIKPHQTTAQTAAPKKTGGAFPAVASYFIDGLGQYIDDRNKSAAKYFLRGLGAFALTGIGTGLTIAAGNRCSKVGMVAGAVLGGAGLIGSVVNKLQDVKDAYQGEKAPTIDTNA